MMPRSAAFASSVWFDETNIANDALEICRLGLFRVKEVNEICISMTVVDPNTNTPRLVEVDITKTLNA